MRVSWCVIAEGFERGSPKDFAHFLIIARGSLSEIRAQILLAQDLKYIPVPDSERVLNEAEQIHKMLNAFKKTLTIKKGLS